MSKTKSYSKLFPFLRANNCSEDVLYILEKIIESKISTYYVCELHPGVFEWLIVPNKYLVTVLNLESEKIVVDYQVIPENEIDAKLSGYRVQELYIATNDSEKVLNLLKSKNKEETHWAEKRFQIMGAALLAMANELKRVNRDNKLLSKRKGTKIINVSNLAQEIEDMKESFWGGSEGSMSFSKKNIDETIRNSIKPFGTNWEVDPD
jgi:hypothetical protein